MREILFRGKRIEDGEWAYGSLLIDYVTGKFFIHAIGNSVNDSDKVGEDGILNFVAFEVIPETVGQYTGLLDKNSKKIFEGDIVVDRWANEYTPVFQNGIYMAYNPKHLTQNGPSTQFNVIWKDGCEIIGNIHEEVQE